MGLLNFPNYNSEKIAEEKERRRIQALYWPVAPYKEPPFIPDPTSCEWRQVMIFPMLCFQGRLYGGDSNYKRVWYIQTLPWNEGGANSRLKIIDDAAIACLSLMPSDNRVVR